MKKTFIVILALLFSMQVRAADEGYNEQQGQHVRVTNNDDGSRTIYKRIPGQRQMTKRTYDPLGRRVSVAVYITDDYGETRSCKIYDGKLNLLFKVQYGYDSLGRLEKEYMRDAKTNELVSIYFYGYKADGSREKPVCIVQKPGPKVENRFQFSRPSALETDPFAEDEKTKVRGTPIKSR